MINNNFPSVSDAYNRIRQYIRKTPLVNLDILDNKLGNKVYLKLDSEQITGAFKIRAVLNHLLALKEQGRLPNKIVGYSTGNHALAMGYCAQLFNLEARIYVPNYVSAFKAQLIREYPVELIFTNSRQESEDLAFCDQKNDYYYLHPSDSDESIAGAGTMCYEALQDMGDVDAIFASCGGGGLLAGSYLAAKSLASKSFIYGAEPALANDAYISVKSGNLYKFEISPNTIADGLKALSLSQRTYQYLKNLDDIILVGEEEIDYWTKFCQESLNLTIEPSSAISIAAAKIWSSKVNSNKNILILISGKNYENKQLELVDRG